MKSNYVFSIRKVSFGAASVAVAALFMFLGNGAVSAAEQGVPSTNGETQAPQPKDQNVQNGTYEGNTVAISPAATVETNTQPQQLKIILLQNHHLRRWRL